MGDVLAIECTIPTIGHRSAVIHQQVLLDGSATVVASADVTFVAFSAQQKKAVQLGGELKTMLESMQETQ
jgi:thioesterase-3